LAASRATTSSRSAATPRSPASSFTCTDEYIQPYPSSVTPGATNINLRHGFTGHFQTMYDPAVYLIMHDALTR